MSVRIKRKMEGAIKPFDQKLHDELDKKGRDAFCQYLNNIHIPNKKTIHNNVERGIDLLTLDSDDKVMCAWEIEVKKEKSWNNQEVFPHERVHCLTRKDYQWRKDQEFYDLIPYNVSPDCSVYYIILNYHCTKAVLLRPNLILRYRPVYVQNELGKNEFFRRIPVEKVLHLDLTTGIISKVSMGEMV